ncbi:MAG: DUF3179 domain-containing protein [Candidatus Hodarchaeales archaeon]
MRNHYYGIITSIILIGIILGFGIFTIPTDHSDPINNSNNLPKEFPFVQQEFNILEFNSTPWTAEELSDNVKWGGVGKDGIPPIENPKYVSGLAADSYLLDTDIVFGLDFNGQVIAYPQYILVWHEIVNENFKDLKITLSYCPLTGSAVGFVGHFLTVETTFGVSGSLLNSNLVMYDRDSDSRWPQILGQSIDVNNVVIELEKVQLFWTTWAQWYKAHPDTLVLSEETGHFRSYGSDPYGDYLSNSSYYTSGSPWFPVMTNNNNLSDKTVVYGVSIAGSNLAIEKDLLRSNKVLNLNLSDQRIVAFYDNQLDVARIYKSTIDDQDYAFKFEDGKFIDLNTDTEWTIEGKSSIGSLEPIVYFDVMWFAWFSFHPDTTLIYVEG